MKLPNIGERIEIASRYVPIAKRMLDVGCGDGVIYFFLKNKVQEIYGIDNNKKDLLKAKKNRLRTKVCYLDTEKFPFNNNYFNVVTCLDVIEHIKNPNFLLSEIYRVLEKEGILILSTPNIRFSDHLLKLILKGIFPKTSEDSSIYDGGHIHFFTFSDMHNLLSNSRFKIILEEGIINKEKRGWKGRILERLVGKRFMLEFRSPGILIIAKKV